jgi:hypothetical protein
MGLWRLSWLDWGWRRKSRCVGRRRENFDRARSDGREYGEIEAKVEGICIQ